MIGYIGCEYCGNPATIIEVWGDDDVIYVCKECSVPGVGEPIE